MMIEGTRIHLVPATLHDKQAVYQWCFHSETTPSHSGPPHFPDVLIPSFEAFCADYYDDDFFTDAAPNRGRGYIIRHKEQPVGFVSYTSFHMKPGKAEFDIWMNCEANCGKGFGTDALLTLANELADTLGVCEFIMRPSAKNRRALRAYQKAGFEASRQPPSDYLLAEYLSLYGDGDYGEGETALLVKRIQA